jgi:hypothetical protein
LHACASSISKRQARSGTASTTATHGKECCRLIVGRAVKLHAGATSGTTFFFINTHSLVLLNTFRRMHETEMNRRLVRIGDSLVDEGANTCWVCGTAFQQFAEWCGDIFLAISRLGLHIKVKSISKTTFTRRHVRMVASDFCYCG